ncbi:MAG TPA: glycosyltransferase family 4 protein, partial [Paludibacteraceae bacterium]|nr:glycosyltransferase family 4 protein [Paludibacteraceae bacterium]HQJ89132.1 glycosyltransferase family 4 protein [Paludibacteraceae bacterium]
IEIKGYTRAEMATLYYASNVLLMTSHTEGSPQVIKEAMASGCPIVSVDVGDVAERIDGIEGCYIAERDPAAIAQKLRMAFDFNGRTEGRRKIDEMGLDNNEIAKNLIQIYQNVSNKR